MQDAMHNDILDNQRNASPAYSLPVLPNGGGGSAEFASNCDWHLEALPPGEGNSVVGYSADAFLTQRNEDRHLGYESSGGSDVGFQNGMSDGQYPLENPIPTNTFPEDATFSDVQPASPGFSINVAPQTKFTAPGLAYTGAILGHPDQTYPSMHAPTQNQQAALAPDAYAPSFAQPIPGTATVAAQNPQAARVACRMPGCLQTFRRYPDRERHEIAVHRFNQANSVYVCPVIGCPKSLGTGYTRKDKLTEHLWKKHGNLGYTKRVQ